jgi:hypothetical protein
VIDGSLQEAGTSTQLKRTNRGDKDRGIGPGRS